MNLFETRNFKQTEDYIHFICSSLKTDKIRNFQNRKLQGL